MKIELGVKSDPIEYRYSFDWLFELMQANGVPYVQLGSWFEMYFLDDAFFHDLREKAERRNVRIKSCFTAHRELGGFLTGDPRLEKVARRNYERYIQIGEVLGVDYLGSNPGAIYRDRMETKPVGLERYIRHIKELVMLAREQGIKAMTLETMSCAGEPPSFPDEILYLMQTFAAHHQQHPDSTVPLYICGDVTHGVADQGGNVQHDSLELFELAIPYMAEFHLKNTDRIFHSTYGFSRDEQAKGIIDLHAVRALIEKHANQWPVNDVVGYLELPGPKLGRDYTDYTLGPALVESLAALQEVF